MHGTILEKWRMKKMIKYATFWSGIYATVRAHSYSEALIRAMEFFCEDDYNKIEVIALP